MKKLLCLCLVLFACQTVQINETVKFEKVNQGIYANKDVIILINEDSILIQSVTNPEENLTIQKELKQYKDCVFYKSVSGIVSLFFCSRKQRKLSGNLP